MTPEEEAQAAAADAEDGRMREDLQSIVAKARDVFAGNSTFTAAQLQKIVAGLVLLVYRRLR